MKASFTVEGDVATFDADGFRLALLARFSDADDVTLVVTPASIRVDATIVMPDESTATSAADVITTTPISEMQRDWFASVGGGAGITINSMRDVSVGTVSIASISPPAAPTDETRLSDGQNLGIGISGEGRSQGLQAELFIALVAGGAGAIVSLVVGGCIYHMKRRCGGRVGVRRAHSHKHEATQQSKKFAVFARTRVSQSTIAAVDGNNMNVDVKHNMNKDVKHDVSQVHVHDVFTPTADDDVDDDSLTYV